MASIIQVHFNGNLNMSVEYANITDACVHGGRAYIYVQERIGLEDEDYSLFFVRIFHTAPSGANI